MRRDGAARRNAAGGEPLDEPRLAFGDLSEARREERAPDAPAAVLGVHGQLDLADVLIRPAQIALERGAPADPTVAQRDELAPLEEPGPGAAASLDHRVGMGRVLRIRLRFHGVRQGDELT